MYTKKCSWDFRSSPRINRTIDSTEPLMDPSSSMTWNPITQHIVVIAADDLEHPKERLIRIMNCVRGA